MSILSQIHGLRTELGPVILVAATKNRSISEIKEAVSAGVTIIGENYVQEAEEKRDSLGGVEVHLIGHLQRNKTKKAVKIFDCIQTIDSVKIASEVDKRCGEIGKKLDVMIEVNVGGEVNKSGCKVEDVEEIIKVIVTLSNLRLVGLMTMAPYFEDNEAVRPYFKQMKQIFDRLQKKHDLKWLSMGMSHSYKIAIEEGANMVRIGSGIFGKR
jgi:PLP dependent protein